EVEVAGEEGEGEGVGQREVVEREGADDLAGLLVALDELGGDAAEREDAAVAGAAHLGAVEVGRGDDVDEERVRVEGDELADVRALAEAAEAVVGVAVEAVTLVDGAVGDERHAEVADALLVGGIAR